VINRLMDRLHRVFNKEPQKYAVLAVTSTVGGTIDIDRYDITISHKYGTFVIPIGSKTLNQVLIEIDALQYITATLKQPTYSYMLAKGVLPATSQDMAVDGNLYMSESIFYNEMQVYAGKMEEQADQLTDAEKQLYFHSATDTWLDYWARDYFGNPRKTGETDSQYMPRVIAEIIRLTQNNKAMEVLLASAIPELNIEITDLPAKTWGERDYQGDFLAYSEIDTSGEIVIRPDYFETIASTANKVKSAGTRLNILLMYLVTSGIWHTAFCLGQETTKVYPLIVTEGDAQLSRRISVSVHSWLTTEVKPYSTAELIASPQITSIGIGIHSWIKTEVIPA